MIRSSIQVTFTGGQVDWIIKTSMPRTFSFISTRVSPSLKVVTLALPKDTPKCWQIFVASAMLALPENTLILSNILNPSQYIFWLGREGSNLRMQESKSCVLPLDDAPM